MFFSTNAFPDVSKLSGKKGSPDIIIVSGEITEKDYESFKKIAVGTDQALVLLRSSGGLIKPAIDVGKIIRIKGYSTFVGPDSSCVSACALIWLAGQPRMITKTAGIGFHGAYFESEDGKKLPTSVGNALVGAYLGNLGFSERLISYVTAAGPTDIEWLSKTKSENLGLSVTYIDDKLKIEKAIELYSKGLEIRSRKTQDPQKVAYYYKSSADEGFAGAQNNLGDLYESGTGVSKDIRAAVYWYTRSAERGEPTAYLSLTTVLLEGNPDSYTLIEALKFGYLAYERLPEGINKKTAFKSIREIESKLSQKAIEYAKLLARRWEPLYQETHTLGDTPESKR